MCSTIDLIGTLGGWLMCVWLMGLLTWICIRGSRK